MTSQPPGFTPREEEREIMHLTKGEIAAVDVDLRGLTATFESLGLETCKKEQERAGLLEMDAEISRIPYSSKSVFLEAKRRCPELVNDEHKTPFLWREESNSKLAAWRLVNYWEYKYKLFGTPKCFLPLSLDLIQDDLDVYFRGIVVLLPVKDKMGRGILYTTTRYHDSSQYPTESLARVFWYMFHVACEDPAVQELGCIIMADVRNAGLKSVDPGGIGNEVFSMDNILPLPFRAFHLCHPPAMYHTLDPLIKFVIGKKMRLRFKVHYGSEEDVLESLAQFGLPRTCLPDWIGGDIVLDLKSWILERISKENSSPKEKYRNCDDGLWQPTRAGNLFSTKLTRLADLATSLKEGVASALQNSSPPSIVGNGGLSFTQPFDVPASKLKGEPDIHDRGAEGQRASRREAHRENLQKEIFGTDTTVTKAENASENKNNAVPAVQASQKSERDMVTLTTQNIKDAMFHSPAHGDTRVNPTSPGRNEIRVGKKPTEQPLASDDKAEVCSLPKSAVRADPRMNKAVEAKIGNPSLSYLDALRFGGFSYPSVYEQHKPDAEVFDDENISLKQRKNQLARRIRKLKKITKQGL